MVDIIEWRDLETEEGKGFVDKLGSIKNEKICLFKFSFLILRWTKFI